MRILLAQNSLYYPSHGGGDKSNRLLIEALAARGHECRVVARIPVFGVREHEEYLAALTLRGVEPLTALSAEPLTARSTEPLAARSTESLTARTTEPLTARTTELLTARTTEPLTARTTEPLTARSAESLAAHSADALPARTTEPLTARSTEPLTARSAELLAARSAESLAAHSADALPARTTEPLTARSTDALPTHSAEPLAAHSADALPARTTEPLTARIAEPLTARSVEPVSAASGVVRFNRAGVAVHVVTNANLRAYFQETIETFRPDVILASTDDPAQLLLETALAARGARVVYLVRATLAVPFGPDCAFPSEAKTARIRATDAVVGVSQYVADYCRRYAAIDAVHVPISLLEPEDWPAAGRLENEFVTLVNPCAVKGISIFLALADAFPQVAFAAVPTWGTTQRDRTDLRARPNITLLDPVDDIDRLFARTRVLLVPSLWAEARSRIVLEAMLRGVPVIAANAGGIPEAKMGVPYLLPVTPIAKYEPRLDEQMVPVPDVPEQDVEPWREALDRLLTDRRHYVEISAASREAALDYAARLSVVPFEALLQGVLDRPLPDGRGTVAPARPSSLDALSPDKRRLLALRLRKKAPPAAWFPGIAETPAPRLFSFPHAGGVSRIGQPVRLPGRESRVAEAPFERMGPLIDALASAIEPYTREPYAFFGHSMGAAIAFELARELRRRGLPLPALLIASAARAPQFRRNHVPPHAPTDSEFLEELRRLEGIPPEALDDPALLRALLPAIQADATLYRNYIFKDETPLPFPLRAYGGADDPNIRRDHLAAWQEQTIASFAVRLFPGGHFYLRTCPEEFGAALKEDLECWT